MIIQIILIIQILAILSFKQMHQMRDSLRLVNRFALYSQRLALLFAFVSFALSLSLWIFFDKLTIKFQHTSLHHYYSLKGENSESFIDFFWPNYIPKMLNFGVDGVSIFFVVLTTFITLLSILCVIQRTEKESQLILISLIFLIQFFCIIIFTILDLFWFYVFFESVLMPMFILIGIWGSNYVGRLKAGYYFFLYTLAGSVLLLVAIIIIILETNTTSMYMLSNLADFGMKKQILLFLFTFLGFAVKIPIYPFHLWLPEAHVEAPTEGSVFLASILLKLGGYGFLRISLPLLPFASKYFCPLVYTLCILGIIYGSLIALRQVDLKKIVAYSSVAHMNLVVLGIFALNFQGIHGSIFLMFAHGITSGALFFLIGILYDRHGSRNLEYYGGLMATMPNYCSFLLFFTLSNMGVPGTCNFVGEVLVLVGIFQANMIIGILASTGIVFSACYSIWMFNRLAYGNLKTEYIEKFRDLFGPEYPIFYTLFITGTFFGIMPDVILKQIAMSTSSLVI